MLFFKKTQKLVCKILLTQVLFCTKLTWSNNDIRPIGNIFHKESLFNFSRHFRSFDSNEYSLRANETTQVKRWKGVTLFYCVVYPGLIRQAASIDV